ncbi:MAG: biliverdin-producing heme oxygenase [Labilithrix sp.]|nr:biliverdin-producing heme oxygenase [Labilithrix sp.]
MASVALHTFSALHTFTLARAPAPSPTARHVERGRLAKHPPLSRLLRREPRVAQRLAGSTRMARAFFQGTLTAQTYAEGLARLYPVYATIESVLASVGRDDRLNAFDLPDVFRARAILADLRYFGVAPEPIRPGASVAYFEHVRRLADESPTLLVAHAYVRYMVDLTGARIARRLAQRVLQLPPREGLAYLSFPAIAKPDGFREDFRRRLDAFPRDRAEALGIVGEATIACALDRELASELWDERR